MGLIALWHVGSSQTRDWTRVPCIGRWILNHCATREVPLMYFLFLWIFLFWIFHANAIIQFVINCVWLFSLSVMFLRLPCCAMYQYLINFYDWIIFHHTNRPHFVYSFASDVHLNCFHLLVIVNSTALIAVNIRVQVLFEYLSSILLGIYLGVELLGHTFNFLRKHQTVFHSSCTILHSYQQCMRVPIYPNPCQPLLFSGFLKIVAILVGVKWYHCGFDLHFSDD